MFKIGDLIVYGGTGVCRVADIRVQDIPGLDRNRLYYILRPLYQDCTISIPADNPKVFMRPVISRAEAEALIDRIPSIQSEAFSSPVTRELADYYEAGLKSHDCADLVKLTKSIYAKRRRAQACNKKLGAIDERYMKRAEEMLFGELAAVLEIPREQVVDYIARRIGGTPAN